MVRSDAYSRTSSASSWPRLRREQLQHEILNGLGVLERLVEFFARGREFVRAAGVAKRGDLWRQDRRRFCELLEVGIQFRGLFHQVFDVVRFGERIVLRLQPCLDRFLRGLLAMVNGRVQQWILRRRQNSRRLQVVARARQPVADEFRRGLIHKVCGLWREPGEIGKRGGVCNDPLGCAWERARPSQNRSRADSDERAAFV